MKTLILIRHAKSDWSNPFLADFDRGLNVRGLRDAPMMGKILSRRAIHPDLILSSPARRAQMTAAAIGCELSYSEDAIVYDPALYACDVETIIKRIQNVSEDVDILIVFGHNPELTECLNFLGNVQIENIPTCGAATLRLKEKSWKKIGMHSAELLFFDTPKQYRKKDI